MTETAPTLAVLYRTIRTQLQDAGCETPALDARLLICHVMGYTHEEFILHGHDTVDTAIQARIADVIAQRMQGRPVAKIIGRKEFYGRDFITSEATLDPRPDSETLIDAVLPFARKQNALHVLDLGAGTGCLALTLLAELPHAVAVAADLSPDALDVARRNAQALTLTERVTFVHSDWFQNVTGTFDLVVSNPPYIPDADRITLSVDVRDYDPSSALFGGPDGLDPYRLIIPQLATFLRAEGMVAFELGKGQDAAVANMLRDHGFTHVTTHPDLAGIGRIVSGIRAK